MDVAHTRLTNLRTLIKRAGSQSAFARAVDTAPSYISQIIKRVRLPSGKERNVGDDFARSIETALNLPHGWMDVPQTEMPYDPNPEQVQPNHDVWQQGQAAEVRESVAKNGRLAGRSGRTSAASPQRRAEQRAAGWIGQGLSPAQHQLVRAVEMMAGAIPDARAKAIAELVLLSGGAVSPPPKIKA